MNWFSKCTVNLCKIVLGETANPLVDKTLINFHIGPLESAYSLEIQKHTFVILQKPSCISADEEG